MKSVFAPAWILGGLSVLLLSQPLSAGEPPVMIETAVPVLSDIPYLGRLFRTVGIAPAAGRCETAEMKVVPRQTRTIQLVAANEPAVQPKERFVKVTVGVEADGLEQIPLVGSLLKYLIPHAEKCCTKDEECCVENQACCNEKEQCCGGDVDCPPQVCRGFRVIGLDGLERIGVDFDCDVTDNCPACQRVACTKSCESSQAVTFDAVTPNAGILITLLEAREEFHQRESELIDELFEAKLAAAVLQAKLEARDEADAKLSALLEALVTAQIENAKLQAKIELSEEKAKLAAELHEAKAELAALKSQSRGDTAARRTDKRR